MRESLRLTPPQNSLSLWASKPTPYQALPTPPPKTDSQPGMVAARTLTADQSPCYLWKELSASPCSTTC